MKSRVQFALLLLVPGMFLIGSCSNETPVDSTPECQTKNVGWFVVKNSTYRPIKFYINNTYRTDYYLTPGSKSEPTEIPANLNFGFRAEYADNGQVHSNESQFVTQCTTHTLNLVP